MVEEWTEIEVKFWEQSVENQRHFNRLVMQARVFGATIIVAFMAIAARFTVEENGYLWAGVVQIFVIVFSFGLWILDSYYWSLLIASVEYGEELEKKSGQPLLSVGGSEYHGMTEYIHKRVDQGSAKLKQISFYLILLLVEVILAFAYFSPYLDIGG